MPNNGTFHPVRQRLLARINKAPSGCWEWRAAISADTGYGALSVNGRVTGAHRASFQEFNGPIPRGMCVCHRCDNRCCINPDHLFLGTKLDNTLDALSKGRLRLHGLKGKRK